jgi:tripartite-type tricarboxylate transporter receptor subunit TctC
MPQSLRERIARDLREIAESDPVIGKRLADTGQIMTLRGPAEFAGSIEEQRRQLGALARTLGLKGAQP